ncbi:glycosyltransferase family 4 protein [Clostridium fermenticellae]|uniref:Glycosyltransferase family 4 protein n=1 Tax=Clostridium fermenticellae TaxID=2068654 RepID=A0A386H0W5_9CLOT|nr:glycosyltransferase [Clostridium fermenticellae]AYD39337.1 glycosyltransferase family 4 protein [Clostridium fermenticellae]
MKQNNRIKVLVIPSWYPCQNNIINGVFFKEQVEALSGYGVNVGVIYAETQLGLRNISLSKLRSYHFQTMKILEDGVFTYRFMGYSFPPKIRVLKNKFWIDRMVKLADKYIGNNGIPDVIHAHSVLWGGYVAYIVSKKYSIPYIVTEHFSGLARGLISKREKLYAFKVFDNSRNIVCVSNSLKNLLENQYSVHNSIVIPNMVDTEFFYKGSRKCDSEHIFTFLDVCFLTKNKGVDVLINAFYRAFRYDNKVVLHIGGNGEELPKLKELVKKLKIEKKVIFLGELDREKVRHEMQKANCFVLSSHFETFGVVVIEALSTGCPVIATKCGGPEEILNKDIGVLTEKGDVEKLSQAMKYVYNNYNKYNSDSIRKYTIKNYSKESVCKEIVNLYRKII